VSQKSLKLTRKKKNTVSSADLKTGGPSPKFSHGM
jgi:hypothetical protein